MKKTDFSEAIEVLSTIVEAIGAGTIAWGIVNLLEAYDDTEIELEIDECRRSIAELDELALALMESRDAGEISDVSYYTRMAEYDAEIDELREEIRELKEAIEARKTEAIKQLGRCSSFIMLAPLLKNPDTFPKALDWLDKLGNTSTADK